MIPTRRRTLKIIGTGEHHLTKVLDADTGENIGAQLGISRIEWVSGDPASYPRARLILEVLCPVIFELKPSSEDPPPAAQPATA